MIKKLLSIILLLLSFTAFTQPKQDSTLRARLDKIEKQIDMERQHYESEITVLKDKLDYQQNLSERSMNTISVQLDSASYSLTLFATLFAIAAIVLGAYVTYIERKIVRIGEENKELLTKNRKIKEEVEAINQLIQSDIYKLFLKLKREETVHILDRLINVPKDIANFCDILISRELEQDDFTKLKQAYLKLGDSNEFYHPLYEIVFFQHFLARTLQDEKLKTAIVDFIPNGISKAFENDILKSTSDFTTVVVDKGIQAFKKEINLYFKGLTDSEYKDFTPVFQIIFDNLKSRKNRFELFNIVESVPEQRLAKIEFGKILQNQYYSDKPIESELLAFEELNVLITTQQKEEEDVIRKAEEHKKTQEERQKKFEEKRKLREEKQHALKQKHNQANGDPNLSNSETA
jgi:hypothetical protein